MTPSVTIGLTSHRIESLPFARRLMEHHDVIILEEAPNRMFIDMLDMKISINDYIREEGMEFPEFSRRYYTLLRKFYREGKQILLVEPHMEHLIQIYEMFTDGKDPSYVMNIPAMSEVYDAERKATAALLHFYESSLKDSFPEVVDAVKKFARADAERFRMRDAMRAEAISKALADNKRIYVEAGAIHIYLVKVLRDLVKRRFHIKTEYLLEPIFRKLIGKKEVLVPGDLLTIHYILHKKNDEEYETLQAARSIIFIKLLYKEEMIPSRREKAPHVKDRIAVNKLVFKLTFAQCEELYKKIRFQGRRQALETLQIYRQKFPSPV